MRSAESDRVVRVFISSTFRDMRRERDLLAKRTFPEIRSRCRRANIEFVEIDLRWGISDEQARRGETLSICMEEIRRCRPYFIGMLGERYGWVPPTRDSGGGADVPSSAGCSVTELEILHGAFHDGESNPRARFYFRDPAYALMQPPQDAADYQSEGPLASTRLAELKDRIRGSGLPVRENYRDADALAEYVLADLWAQIEADYGPDTGQLEPDRPAPVDTPTTVSGYVPRPRYLQILRSHAETSTRPLVVSGEVGIGKSALLLEWATTYRSERLGDGMFLYRCGAGTPGGHGELIRRGVAALGGDSPGGDPVEPPEGSADGGARVLEAALAACRDGRHFAFVIDGLDRLADDGEPTPDLRWLTALQRRGIAVVVSVDHVESLSSFGLHPADWEELPLAPLDPAERAVLARGYLGVYAKTLPDALIDRVAGAALTGNPLILRTILEELRVWGFHEGLSDYLGRYLAARDAADLFGHVISRWEADYEADCPAMVREVLAPLAAARDGLPEGELLELLATGVGRPVPRATLSPLLLAMENHLVVRGGRLTFHHRAFAVAARRRHLATPVRERIYRRRIASRGSSLSERRFIWEVPWQLFALRDWDALAGILLHPRHALAMIDTEPVHYRDKLDLLLSRHPAGRLFEAAADVADGFSDPAGSDDLARYCVTLGELAERSAAYEPAERLYRRAIEVVADRAGDLETRLRLGRVCFERGRYADALAVLEKPDDGAAPDDRAAGAIGLSYLRLGRVDDARRAIDRAWRCGAEGGPADASLADARGQVLEAADDAVGAEAMYRRAVELSEGTGENGVRLLATSLNNLAHLLAKIGRPAEAIPLYERSLDIRRAEYEEPHPAIARCLDNLGMCLLSSGRSDEAYSPVSAALAMLELVVGTGHPDTLVARTNLGCVLAALGRPGEAVEMFEAVAGSEACGEGLLASATANASACTGIRPTGDARWRELREEGRRHARATAVLRERNDLAGAVGEGESALPLLIAAVGPDHPEPLALAFELAAAHAELRNWDRGEELLRYCRDGRRRVLGRGHPETAQACACLHRLSQTRAKIEGHSVADLEALFREGERLYDRAEWDSAAGRFLEFHDELARYWGEDHPQVAAAFHRSTLAVFETDDFDRMAAVCSRNAEIQSAAFGPVHRHTRRARALLEAIPNLRRRFLGTRPPAVRLSFTP